MSFMNLFRKKTIIKEGSIAVDPNTLPEPTDLAGYLRRGWAFHAHNQEEKAETDFRKALEFDSRAVDALFGLGLILKANNRKEEAIIRFKQTLELINAGVLQNPSRSEMVRRLAMAHINELTIGDWNLEEEVWHHKT